MPPPIAGNGRAKSGRLPLPPAGFSAAVPTSPVAGSLFSHIKWDPRTPFYRFNPIPSLPVVSSPIPAVALSLPRRRRPPAACAASPVRRPAAPSPPPASPPPPPRRPALRFARRPPELRSRRRPPLSFAPATSSRLPLLARAPPGRAVFSLGLAAASSFPASPPFRGEITGDASSPTTSGVATTPPSPAVPAASPERRPTSPSPPSASPHRPPPRLLLGFRRNAVAAPVSPSSSSPVSFRPPLPPPRLVGSLHLHHLRHRSGKVALGLASPPSKPLRGPSSSSPIVLVVDVPSVARLVVSRHRLRHRHRSGVSHVVLVSVQPLPAVLVASSPVPVVVVIVLSSFPVSLVVAFVPPSSRSHPSSASVKQVAAAPVLVFVLGSASSSLVPAASRLRSRIAAEAVPSPFVSVVPVCLRRARSSLSFPRLVAWCIKLRMIISWSYELRIDPFKSLNLSSFRRFPKRGSRLSPKVRKAVLSEQGKSHHP
uniref:Cell wall protein-like n=1 Tax=Oryza sativa subsp. japonica TaxID=39947 RepID=Q6YYS0_ORYSJ|nr:cell wall protein-like [Oryza sativa Japonica Group]